MIAFSLTILVGIVTWAQIALRGLLPAALNNFLVAILVLSCGALALAAVASGRTVLRERAGETAKTARPAPAV